MEEEAGKVPSSSISGADVVLALLTPDRFQVEQQPLSGQSHMPVAPWFLALLILMKLGSQSRVHCDHHRLIGICVALLF